MSGGDAQWAHALTSGDCDTVRQVKTINLKSSKKNKLSIKFVQLKERLIREHFPIKREKYVIIERE